MIFAAYTVIVVIMILLFFLTCHYKYELFCDLDKTKHKLRVFYGIAAFLADCFHQYVRKINYEHIKLKLGRLHTNQTGIKEAYVYIVSRIAISVMVFMVITLVGYIKCVESTYSSEREVVSLQRPKAGEGDREYELTVKHNNGVDNLRIKVEEQRYTQEEADRIFQNHYDELIEKLLGDNDSLAHITEDIKLVYELSDGISVMWEINEPEYIDHSGKINWEKLEDTKAITCRATMSFYEYERAFDIDMILSRQDREFVKKIYDRIENLLTETSEHSEEINLRNVMEEYDVSFYISEKRANLIYLLVAIIAAVIVWFAKEKDTDRELDKRREQLQEDYTEVVSKLTILQGAGMTIMGAWDKIILDYEKQKDNGNKKSRGKDNTGKDNGHKNGKENKRFVYEEMKYARQLMKKGYSEAEAYREFGKRCGIHMYIKLANLLEQNIKKGTKGLKDILNAEVIEAFEERKALARKKGDEAGTKLLLPMGMMLVISIAVIIIPAIMSFNV